MPGSISANPSRLARNGDFTIPTLKVPIFHKRPHTAQQYR
ncbi:hypothetical protein NEIPOLOT_01952 [Neisseria polysaccharea ATCC 43768]|nr:hypothetical protein NEIPOLOT_01952 [Neisseria polysaccharea ATCC 43768]